MENQRTAHLNLLRNKVILWSLIILITMIWGYSFVIMKDALTYMGSFTFAAARFGVGALVLVLLVLILKLGIPPKRYWKHLAAVGLLQTTIVFLFIMLALRFVDAGKTSVLLYSMPMWSSLFAAKLLSEKITQAKRIGLTIGMVGLLFILGTDIWKGENFAHLFGELLIVLAAVAWGISNVYFRLKLNDLPKIQSSAYQMAFGSIGLFIAASTVEWNMPIVWNMESIYYVLFTGIFASALCFTVWFFILSLIDMVTATVSMMLVPVFALLFGTILLGEQLAVSVLLGAVLIIVGVVIAQFKQKQTSI
ncbi:DMT family transporter [Virgibacillus sp. W0430]|uniref:DMT family transporter n=1 Tax=Virgibacillus sp. W0430 TaxID=3391580 RepID=UPI003F446A64